MLWCRTWPCLFDWLLCIFVIVIKLKWLLYNKYSFIYPSSYISIYFSFIFRAWIFHSYDGESSLVKQVYALSTGEFYWITKPKQWSNDRLGSNASLNNDPCILFCMLCMFLIMEINLILICFINGNVQWERKTIAPS